MKDIIDRYLPQIVSYRNKLLSLKRQSKNSTKTFYMVELGALVFSVFNYLVNDIFKLFFSLAILLLMAPFIYRIVSFYFKIVEKNVNEEFKSFFKQNVLTDILERVNPSFRYFPDYYISAEQLSPLNIYDLDKTSTVAGEDCFFGKGKIYKG